MSSIHVHSERYMRERAQELAAEQERETEREEVAE